MLGPTIVKSPREAAQALGGSGNQIVPKQRHLFLVRFYANGAQAGADQLTLSNVSFVAKAVDRPKINPTTQELHQYNKKRQVYTGFKCEPVRMQIYDDYFSNALTMWSDYCQYYFGDFAKSAASDYQYDVTTPQFINSGSGFGFIAPGGADGNGDWFFDRIEIYHFYHQLYDVYQLYHPRITAFDPDDVDYENTAVSVISMTVAYEDLQFTVQNSVASGDARGDPFQEFETTFDGQVIYVPSANPSSNDAAAPGTASSSSTNVSGLLAMAQGTLSNPLDYRYNDTNSTGALSSFGNFSFGPSGQTSLSNLALNNPQLAAALDIGTSVDPLTVTNNSLQGVLNSSAQGINGATYDVAMGRAMAATSPYGNATSTITGALLASSALNGDASVAGPDGITLTPEGYGSINAQQTGTAQYGVSTPADDSIFGLNANAVEALGIG